MPFMRILWAFVLISLLAGTTFGQRRNPRRTKRATTVKKGSLDTRVGQAIQRFPGTVTLYAKNLDSSAEFGVKPDQKVRAASTIKLAIMITAFGEVQAGNARWTEEFSVREDEKIGGAGIVRELSPGVKLPLKDLIHLMIVISDNTATNMLIDRFPGDLVNRYMDQFGWSNTRLLRKILGDRNNSKPNLNGVSEAGSAPENQEYGIGVSTPRELAAIVEKLEKGEVISAEASKEMLEIMGRQQYREGLGRRLAAMKFSSKNGALDALRSDVGIVYSPGGRIVMAITCDGMKRVDWTVDNRGLLLLSELTGILLEGLAR